MNVLTLFENESAGGAPNWEATSEIAKWAELRRLLREDLPSQLALFDVYRTRGRELGEELAVARRAFDVERYEDLSVQDHEGVVCGRDALDQIEAMLLSLRRGVEWLAAVAGMDAAEREAFENLALLVSSGDPDVYGAEYRGTVIKAVADAQAERRRARRAALASRLLELEAVVSEAEARSLPTTATRELIAGEALLDLPPAEADDRLRDQIVALRLQIDAARRERELRDAELAAQRIDAMLEGEGAPGLEALREQFAVVCLAPPIAAGEAHRARVVGALRATAPAAYRQGEAGWTEWVGFAAQCTEGVDPTVRVRIVLEGLSGVEPGGGANDCIAPSYLDKKFRYAATRSWLSALLSTGLR